MDENNFLHIYWQWNVFINLMELIKCYKLKKQMSSDLIINYITTHMWCSLIKMNLYLETAPEATNVHKSFERIYCNNF